MIMPQKAKINGSFKSSAVFSSMLDININNYFKAEYMIVLEFFSGLKYEKSAI